MTLEMKMTGEHFEFLTSARKGDGVFRFRWTLAAGKKGPPEHVHPSADETFRGRSGLLKIWIEDRAHELRPGDTLTIPARTRHRFLNPGPEPAVVDVALDGTSMEDALVPSALYAEAQGELRIRDIFRLLVHDVEANGSVPASAVGLRLMAIFARIARAFGAKPFPPPGDWTSRRGQSTWTAQDAAPPSASI
ncbi:MAG: cupin domain-containing protein [Polyangiaceae bacterium]|nr:cupin domain-containing protein [Polyangiaceae bacterium]